MLSKSERTRLFIIEKSAALFNRKGFHGTSMSDILEATGLAKGGIYGHFASKEEIALEAFEFAFRKISDELALRIKQQTTAPDKLMAIVDYYYTFLSAAPVEGGCPILNFSSHTDASMPELKKAVHKAVRILLDSMHRILLKGQEYKQIKPNLDPLRESEILFSRIEGALMLAQATHDESRLQRLLDDLKIYIQENLKQ
ncbi:MAG: TetR/AcrR family transcriptional regulator [Cytophagaceae bacterium]|jgi:AcrR family transcriptional regulator|nr:TetR/AcrR family transcriptional regulator [Cytophagaceae bacterium]